MDFDGVIVDTFEIAYASTVEVVSQPITRDEYRTFFNGNIYDAKPVPVQEKMDETYPFFKRYSPQLLVLEPVRGMQEIIGKIAALGTLAVISSAINNPIEQFLGKHGMRGSFAKVYGADVHLNKVKKISMALEDFGIAPAETVFITDTLGDIREAAKAGIASIAVTWGFHSHETLQSGNPRAIVHSPEELFAVLWE